MGDGSENLVIRRSCMTLRAVDEDCLRNNIFQSICIILGKVCHFTIDSGSYENIVSIEAMQKLGIQLEQHPKPYKLAWLKKGGDISVSKQPLITFFVGSRYEDSVWFDVIKMDACHLLLARPWQFNRNTSHNGRANTYIFCI